MCWDLWDAMVDNTSEMIPSGPAAFPRGFYLAASVMSAVVKGTGSASVGG